MKRVSMRKIKEALRLSSLGLSTRQIGQSLGLSRSTVHDYLFRARGVGLDWSQSESIGEEELEQRLFPSLISSRYKSLVEPDYGLIHQELKRPGVTLALLWEEYREQHKEGYGYSRFCDLYRLWRGKLSVTMRQHHKAGEKLFVDYSGKTIDITDPLTGELRPAQLFIAALGASSYTFAEASWSQSLEDWTSSHQRCFEFLGGASALLVPDNLKSGITKACLYEPTVNRTYGEMAAHYGAAVIPARPYKPRDKAKVETAVLLVQRWILARLRNETFFSLEELNAAIRSLLDRFNNKTSRHLGASRRELFERLDQPALQPLPLRPWSYGEWKLCAVAPDYHVQVDKHCYSVPHNLVRQKLWVRASKRTIEAFLKGKRVASHARGAPNYQHTTISQHMPSAHRRYAQWTPDKLKRQANAIGNNTGILVEVIMRERRHPEQGFRACTGIIRLAKAYGAERLEAACERALEINARSYSSVNSILKNNYDRRRPQSTTEEPAIQHTNIRGANYFH